MEDLVTAIKSGLIDELRNDVVECFKRTAIEFETTPAHVQFTAKLTEEGVPYFEALKDWKKVRDATFKKDFLGLGALGIDWKQKEAMCMPFMMKKLEEAAATYAIKSWTNIAITFLTETDEVDPIVEINILEKDEAGNPQWQPKQTIDLKPAVAA